MKFIAKQRARARESLGNNQGSIMLITLVLLMAVTVIAVGLNTSILATAEDTYGQYYETQSYYTARSVATAIAQEIAAQSETELITIKAKNDNGDYATADDVVELEALLIALAELRESTTTTVSLDNIKFDSASFVEGTGDYIKATITQNDNGTADVYSDDTYIVTAVCEISGVSDTVSVELTTAENTITIWSDSSVGEGVIPGIYGDSLTIDINKFSIDSSAILASADDLYLTTESEVYTLKKTTIMCQGDIHITSTRNQLYKMEEGSVLYALGDIYLDASDGKIELDGVSLYATGTIYIEAGSDDLEIKNGTMQCYTIVASGSTSKIKFSSVNLSMVNAATGISPSYTRLSSAPTVSVVTRSEPDWLTDGSVTVNTVSSDKSTSSVGSSGTKYYHVKNGATLTVNTTNTMHIYGEVGTTIKVTANSFKGTLTGDIVTLSSSGDFSYTYSSAGTVVSSDDYVSSAGGSSSSTSATYYIYAVSQYVKG